MARSIQSVTENTDENGHTVVTVISVDDEGKNHVATDSYNKTVYDSASDRESAIKKATNESLTGSKYSS